MLPRLPQRLHVPVLTAIGYAYLWFAFAAMFAITAACFVYFVLFARLVGELVCIVRSLFLRTPRRVQGARLSRQAAPRFHALVREVQRTLGAPRISKILVDASFNAGVTTQPRLRRLLPDRTTLIVGLPLFYALTIDELRAVLGHELAHVAHRDVESHSPAFRLRARCVQVSAEVEQRRFPFARWFLRFFSWFLPRLDRAIFERSRLDELRADAGAARVTSPDTFARGLVKFVACSRFLGERFWPNVTDRAAHAPHPPENVLDELRRALVGIDGESELEQWLASAEADPGAWFDTHPSLHTRLDALGVPRPALRLTLASSAAAELLGPAEEDLRRQVSADWRAESEPWWHELFEQAEKARGELRELERGATDVPALLEQASLTAWLDGAPDALPVWQAVLELDPGNPDANAGVAIVLLERGDQRGLAHAERALDGSTRTAFDAASAAADYLESKERLDEAAHFRAIADERGALLWQAAAERRTDFLEWEFEAHGLDEATVADIRAKVFEVVKPQRVYLVRRTVRMLADEFPTFVLVVLRKRRVIERADVSQKLQARLREAIKLPGDFHVFVSHEMTGEVAKMFRVDGGLIVGKDNRRRQAVKAGAIAIVGSASVVFAIAMPRTTLPVTDPQEPAGSASSGAGVLTVDAQEYQVFSVATRPSGARTRVVVSSLLRPLNGSRATVPIMWLRSARGVRFKPILGQRRVGRASSVYTKVTDVYLVPRAQVHGLELALPNGLERQSLPLTT